MNSKTRTFFFFIIGAGLGMLLMYLFSNYTLQKKTETSTVQTSQAEVASPQKSSPEKTDFSAENQEIDKLTAEDVVIDFVKKNHKLPDYYITKSEARKQGWIASEGNLCEVLPGKAIGGDHFGNREKKLPKGVQYFEADVNYSCGNRNSDRIVFTENGEIWLTKNHYKTFEKQ